MTPAYTVDLERAKQLLREAGHPNGFFKATVKVSPQYPLDVADCQIIKNHLQRIGIELDIQLVEWGQFLKEWLGGNYDTVCLTSGPLADSDGFTYDYFHSKSPRNRAKFFTGELDDIVTQARMATDPAKRRELLLGQKRVLDLAPVICLYSANGFEVHRYAREGLPAGRLSRAGVRHDVARNGRVAGARAAVLARRLLVLVRFSSGISMLSFLLLSLIPGDVVDILMGTESGDPARLAELRRLFGLDRSLPVRYVRAPGVVQGDLGRSFVTRRPVLAEILGAFPVTLQLTAASLLVALVIGLPLGIYAAVKRRTLGSAGISVFVLLGLSVPNFWLGILLILFASLYLHWFPPQGLHLVWQQPWETVKQLLFPSAALGLAMAAMVMRMTRACVLDVLAQDYVRTARAKGLGEWFVLGGHALRNALIPIVTLVGLQLGYLLGGTIVIEEIFSLPGMGRLVLRSISQRDTLRAGHPARRQRHRHCCSTCASTSAMSSSIHASAVTDGPGIAEVSATRASRPSCAATPAGRPPPPPLFLPPTPAPSPPAPPFPGAPLARGGTGIVRRLPGAIGLVLFATQEGSLRGSRAAIRLNPARGRAVAGISVRAHRPTSFGPRTELGTSSTMLQMSLSAKKSLPAN